MRNIILFIFGFVGSVIFLSCSYNIQTNKDINEQLNIIQHIEFYDIGEIKEEGYYVDGKMNGKWTYYYENGVIKATGHFSNGDGGNISKFSGIPRNGRNGLWIFNYENGKINSELNFKNGKQHGKQIDWYENGRIMRQATFKDDLLNGKSVTWYDNGQKMSEGKYKDGTKNGLWRGWYENSQKEREGTFRNGELNGKNTVWYENGQLKYKWYYKDGIEHGKHIAFYENGNKKYEHIYKDSLLDGKQTIWFENGNKMYESNYSHGQLHGNQKGWFENGKIEFESNYKYGLLNGMDWFWYESGKMESMGTYKDGKEDGYWVGWYENGYKKEEGDYLEGERDGNWTTWNINGKKTSEEYWVNGIIDSKTSYSWYKNGQMRYEINFKYGGLHGIEKEWYEDGKNKFKHYWNKGRPDGEWVEWYNNGQKKYEGNWDNGSREGEWHYYYINGNIEKEGYYKNDEMVSDWTFYYEYGNIKKNPKFLTLLENGKAEFQKPSKVQDYTKAINSLEKAVLIEPKNQEAHYFLGYAYSYLNSKDTSNWSTMNKNKTLTEKASYHFQRVIEISPKYDGEMLFLDPYSKLTGVWGSQAMEYLLEGKIDSAIWSFKEGNKVGGFFPSIMEYNKNMLASCEQDAILFTNGDNDTFPSWFLQLVENYRPDITVVNLSLLNTSWYMKHLRGSRTKEKRFIKLSDSQIDGEKPYAINPITNDSLYLRVTPWESTTVSIPVTSDSLNREGKIFWEVQPTFGENGIRIQDLMIMHIITENKWRYPIYFAMTVSQNNKIGLDKYLQMEGLVFRLQSHTTKLIDYNRLKYNLWNVYSYDGVFDKNRAFIPAIDKLYQNYRSCFLQLAARDIHRFKLKEIESMASDEELESLRIDALIHLNLMEEKIPESAIPVTSDELYFSMGRLYNDLRELERSKEIFEHLYAKDSSNVKVSEMLSKVEEELALHHSQQIPGHASVRFTHYDEPPSPIGGYTYILKNITYSEIPQDVPIEGIVVISAFVDKYGQVTELTVLKAIPGTGLDEAVMRAIRKTHFKPAKQGDRAIGAWISIPVNLRKSLRFIHHDEPPIPIGGYAAIQRNIIYPEIAQEARIEGTVVISAFVDENGEVTELTVLKGVPGTGLDEAAMKAVRKTRFKPAKQGDRAIGVWISIPVNFQLK